MKKALSNVQIKDATQGLVEAVFATFDVIDHDGDVTLKGAFTEGAPVVISAYGHKSHVGELPVGFGTIHEIGNEAIMKGRFLLNTTHGRDTFETIKALSEQGLQEWSYSLDQVEAERGTKDGRSVRVLKRIGLVKEVSPVLQGAGVDTHTVDVKSVKQLASMISRMLNDAGRARWEHDYSYVYLDDFDVDAGTAVFCICDYSLGTRDRYFLQVAFTRTDTAVTLGDDETPVEYTTLYLPKGSKFSEHKDIALRGVTSLVEMAVDRLTVRGTEGKSIAEQTGAYDDLVAALVPLKSAIDDATQPPPVEDDVLEQFAADAVRFTLSMQGA